MATTRRIRRAAPFFVAALAAGCSSSSSTPVEEGWKPGEPMTFDVSLAFSAGTVVHDAYGATTATVAANGTVTVVPDKTSGVVLLEKAGAAPTPFRWKNSVVYFVVTDRFQNGSTANDASFGRKRDGAQDIGTWHGGDLAGLTSKLDYIASLGATAIWISPFVEQVHGWVGGGTTGDFKHWGYHGYWALDFTRIDPNFGTTTELAAFVDGAHARGIRVLADVVMNHPGYATGADLKSYLPLAFNDGTGAAFDALDATTVAQPPRYWFAWNDLVNYRSTQWFNWWSGYWVRAGLGPTGCTSPPPCYPAPNPGDDLTMSVGFLPDFITEGVSTVAVAPILLAKGDSLATSAPDFTVRDYLVKWHSDWVRQVGFDGFRCDTAKNVELASWKALKDASTTALADWKAANPGKKIDDAPFWMTGEVFGHGVVKDAYYTSGGFDSLLNFEFQTYLRSLLATQSTLPAIASDLDAIWAGYAASLSGDPSFDALTYLSSHDTFLFFEAAGESPAKMRQSGTALLLSPGGVQIFYGDESGRLFGPSGSDTNQGTRSDMNWATSDATILAHFQKLGAFRKRHSAVGAGTHQRVTSPAGTYGFVRRLADGTADDAVAVFLVPPG